MSDDQRKVRTKNWGLQILLCAGVAVWQAYQLTASGEAQPNALIILEFIILGCALVGLIGGIVMHFSRQ